MHPAVRFFEKIIEYTFYAIFLFVPLVLTNNTSELFEFNKLWLTFVFTFIIGASWISKMILQRRISFMRTPLDIPILLFVASQGISTIFSLDFHVSLWGYYSRFNGGLFSILSYVILYYAFVSNFFDTEIGKHTTDTSQLNKHQKQILAKQKQEIHPTQNGITVVKRLLLVSLFSGGIVALWGFPSHFGYDPTCWLFRQSLDVSCWTDQFKPTIRMFSTMGQPDWLAAYLSVLLPITIFFAIKSQITNPFGPSSGRGHKSQINTNAQKQNSKYFRGLNLDDWKLFGIWNLKFGIFFLLTALFYADLIYTDARSGFLGFWIGLAFFMVFLVVLKTQAKKIFLLSAAGILGLFLLLNFFLGTPIAQLDPITFEQVKIRMSDRFSSPPPSALLPTTEDPKKPGLLEQTRVTESGHIRLIVWEGALDIWKHNPLFGSGVETFAFSYYRHRPVEHNLTSEWDYLYNKAHNEYLNFLATTGAVGLGTYLFMIGFFLFTAVKYLLKKNSHEDADKKLFIIALTAGYISLLISNFFGFSVVMVNLFLFLIPAFVFILTGSINSKTLIIIPKNHKEHASVSGGHIASATLVWILAMFYIFVLFQFWRADKAYYLGSNLNKVGRYQEAYPYLREAVLLRGDEPVFKDEISIASAVLAVAYAQNKDTQTATTLAEEALTISSQVTNEHPNNVLFWKTRTRALYTLSQLNKEYLPLALEAISKAHELAPTDAKVSYNLGLLYGQTGDSKKATEELEKTVQMKPDYRDAYYALGLFYHELAIDKNGTVVHAEIQKKAVKQMQYILDHLIREDAQAKEALKTWGAL